MLATTDASGRFSFTYDLSQAGDTQLAADHVNVPADTAPDTPQVSFSVAGIGATTIGGVQSLVPKGAALSGQIIFTNLSSAELTDLTFTPQSVRAQRAVPARRPSADHAGRESRYRLLHRLGHRRQLHLRQHRRTRLLRSRGHGQRADRPQHRQPAARAFRVARVSLGQHVRGATKPSEFRGHELRFRRDGRHDRATSADQPGPVPFGRGRNEHPLARPGGLDDGDPGAGSRCVPGLDGLERQYRRGQREYERHGRLFVPRRSPPWARCR